MSQDDAYKWLFQRANDAHGGAAVCHGCRRPLVSGEPILFGLDRVGDAYVVAKCCNDLVETVILFGCWVAAKDAPAFWLRHIEPQSRA